MPCCSAVNCSNRDDRGPKKVSLFRFPADAKRKEKWAKNCRRGSWTPTTSSRLCEKHFEESQFECNRADGWRKLKPNAIPTLFDVPNPPRRIDPLPRKSLYKPTEEEFCHLNVNPDEQSTTSRVSLIAALLRDNANLQEQRKLLSTALQEPTSNLEFKSITTCAVPGCASTSSDECVEFFPFPESKMTRYKWLQFCGSDAVDLDSTIAHICSKHFEENSYITEIKNFGSVTCLIRALNPEAVPVRNSSKDCVKLKEECDQNTDVNEPTVKLDTEVYGHIKTQEDLLKLKICNEMLKKKNQVCRMNLKANKRNLKRKEAILSSLESQVSKKKILYEEVLSKVFSKSQIKLLCGRKRTHWTDDDFAAGFTIRCLSNRVFYNYLTNTLNFPLPALSSIRRFITINKGKNCYSSRSLLKDEA